MDILIVRSIVPKLALVLREFVINPQEQYLDPFKWVMNWIDLVPVIHMTNIFDIEFFPKWFRVLYEWLSNKPNYDEITRWYLGWKSMFPPEMLAQMTIINHFNRALDLINQTLSHPGVLAEPMILKSTPIKLVAAIHTKSPAKVEASPSPGISDEKMSMKELYEYYAKKYDLLFMPKFGNTWNGKKLYVFEKATICMDRELIYMQIGKDWKAVDMATLLASAK